MKYECIAQDYQTDIAGPRIVNADEALSKWFNWIL